MKRMLALGAAVLMVIGLLGMASGCTALIIMHSTLANSIITQLFVASIALYMLYRLEFVASYKFITGKPEPDEVEDEELMNQQTHPNL